MRDLCNAFLTDRKAKRDAGELAPRSFADYFQSCEKLLSHLGKTAVVEEIRVDDLMAYRRKLSKTLGPVALGNEINRAKIVLRFAFEGGLTDRPIRFGGFKRPSQSVLRRARAENGPKMFERVELVALLDASNVPMTAMILLGLNAGFGNGDVGRLPVDAINLTTGWIDFPRPKTGTNRRCPLWPETVKALQAALAYRKDPNDRLVFRTVRGAPWYVETTSSDPLSQAFTKLQKTVKVYRHGRSFYGLRHSFQTIGEETADGLAVKQIMGHIDGSISAAYRERFADARLVAVTDHVRSWLFPSEQD
jgi:integrase